MIKVVLVGGGHVHLHFIKQLSNNRLDGLEVILISPSLYQYYSGMFSGYAEGLYEEEDIRLDLQKLSKKATVTFIEDAVVKIHPNENYVTLKGEETVNYDIISFDIGSETLGSEKSDIMSHAQFIKPNNRFTQTIEHVRSASKPVIVGGGIAGIELSFSIHAWRNNRKIQSPITLVTASRLLESEDKKTSEKLFEKFKKTNINLLTNSKVDSINHRAIHFNNGKELSYEKILWLTGPKSSNLFKRSELETDDKGFLMVTNSLQSMDYENIFAAGDCATLIDYPNLPKNGVYAIKQAPILYKNVLRYIKREPFEYFKPQNRFLSILSLGNRRALLLYGGMSLSGKFPWRLKNYIDKKYIDSFK
ncbi:pyridine nucleotide-disulfide oxidoreductase [Salipaludibacillus keqinensis]|uniref:Pyridine nucleotide-disulfide oxidoreductase n=1 Tax=Salipaludibacillus keqinensis TaxID=2045207 RepID=A0A323TRN1_9BACI|nr:FAD-dependent oxidoreductase [Salipaludibacillus keqinensis]PYZ95203.1 pyridine nucleotide-disulfide oxidoreductase [Salipaludibacillus keqinensis]